VRRVVLDCNVFVSALLSSDGTPAQILERWADGAFDLIISPLLLAELERVLSRPKFRASIDGIHSSSPPGSYCQKRNVTRHCPGHQRDPMPVSLTSR
jgi:predicted nucleic acid-binding protein